MANYLNFPTSNFGKWRADSEGFVNAGEVDRFNYSLDLWANEVEHWTNNQIPRGIVGFGVDTDGQGGFGAGGFIANLVVTFDQLAGRYYQTIMHLTSCGSTAVSLMTASVTDNVGLAIAASVDRMDIASGQAPLTVVTPPETSSVTVLGQVRRGAFGVSAGVGSIQATATQPLSITVIDLGVLV